MMGEKAPVVFSTTVKPEWLDYNNHLNVAYYVLIFDLAGTELLTQLGLSEEAANATGISWMVLENHIAYIGEVGLDQPVEVSAQILDHDSKRMHLYFELYAEDAGGERYLSSTLEQMAMCVDLNTRRSCDFPQGIFDNITQLSSTQTDLPAPEGIGRTIGIRRK